MKILEPNENINYIYGVDNSSLITLSESRHSESVSTPTFGTINTEFIMSIKNNYTPNQKINKIIGGENGN